MERSAQGSRHWLWFAGIAILAILIAEGFLNLVISPTMEKSLWFTGGIHQPDKKFGFRFSPNYHGWMRFPDGVYLERLELDEFGDRMPAERPGSGTDVVLIGGYSMTFSYGVKDEQTIHHVLCNKLKLPTRVRNTAWPGFDPVRNFQIYKDQVGTGKRAELAVVFFFEEDLAVFAGLPDPTTDFKDPQAERDLFSFFGHHALQRPRSKVQDLLGTLYYHSVLVHKLGSTLGELEKKYIEQRSKLTREKAKGQTSPLPDPSELGKLRIQQFANELYAYFGNNEHVLFICLPSSDNAEYYTPLVRALPKGAHVVDLNRTEMDSIRVLGTMALGHYTAPSCEFIGKRIAEELDPLVINSQRSEH